MQPLVVLPTYNERENLPLIVPALLEIERLRISSWTISRRMAPVSWPSTGSRHWRSRSVLHRQGPADLDGRSWRNAARADNRRGRDLPDGRRSVASTRGAPSIAASVP